MIPGPIRRGLRHPIEASLYWSGISHLYAHASGRAGGAIILMYHSVADAATAGFIDPSVRIPPAVFREQMRFLREHRAPLGLNALVQMLDRGETPPRGSVVITFDDGYLDNLQVAAPILAEFDLPATIFLPTRFIDRTEAQWIDLLYAAFAHRTRSLLQLPGCAREQLSGSTTARVYRELSRRLLPLSKGEREDILREVTAQLRPETRSPRTTMGWDEVRTLVRAYPRIEIGSHTIDHTDLTSCDPRQARREVRTSVEIIRAELGIPVRHFSFPYGRSNAIAREIVRDCGLLSAVGPDSDPLVRGDRDRYELPRIEPPRRGSLFRFRTSGAYPGLLADLFGVRQ